MFERILSKCKRQRWDLCEELAVWHFSTKRAAMKFVKPRYTATSPNRDLSYVGSAVCPEWPTKDWRGKFLLATPTRKQPYFVQQLGGLTTSSTLFSPVCVELAVLSEIAVDLEVFWVSGGCSPRPSPEEKRVWKLM